MSELIHTHVQYFPGTRTNDLTEIYSLFSCLKTFLFANIFSSYATQISMDYNRFQTKVILTTFVATVFCFNAYQAHIFRTQSNLEAPPNRERVPVETKTRGHGPFETPRGKIKIGPFSGLTDEQVLQDDGSSNHRRDLRQTPIVMFDIFNFYKPISTLMSVASQALERLWDTVEHLLLSLITHSDPKLDQPHDPNNTQVSSYFLSWAIIASIVMLFAFCAKRYFLNPIFQRWDREQELKLSRFLGGSGQHSKVGPAPGTCLNNNSSLSTPTGGNSKRFTKCTTVSSNSFSSARWTNQCLENIFYVPAVRQRFLNAWLSALNQHCTSVGPQCSFLLEFTEISVGEEPRLPDVVVRRRNPREMCVISDIEMASLLFGLRVYSTSQPEVISCSYVLAFERLTSTVKAVVRGAGPSPNGPEGSRKGLCEFAWSRTPEVKLVPSASINDFHLLAASFPEDRDISERIERTALEALICTDFQLDTYLLGMQDYLEQAKPHVSPLLEQIRLSPTADLSSATRLKVSLIRASLAESRALSFYGTISLDYPHQLLETLGPGSEDDDDDDDDLSQQKEAGHDDGQASKLDGQSNLRENGRKAYGSPHKNAKSPSSTRTIDFSQSFELLVDPLNSKHVTIQLWRDLDDSVLATYTFPICDLMCPVRQSHDINLSKTDKEANGHGNGEQSLGMEHDGTSLKVKFHFICGPSNRKANPSGPHPPPPPVPPPTSSSSSSTPPLPTSTPDPLVSNSMDTVAKSVVTKQVMGPKGRLQTASNTIIYRQDGDGKSRSKNISPIGSPNSAVDNPDASEENFSRFQVAQIALSDLEKLRQNRGFTAATTVLRIRSVQKHALSADCTSKFSEMSSEDTSEKSLDTSTNGIEELGFSHPIVPREKKRRRRFISKIRRKFRKHPKSANSSQDSTAPEVLNPLSPIQRRRYRGRQTKKSSSPGSKSAVIHSTSDMVSKSDTNSTKSSKHKSKVSLNEETEEDYASDSSIEAEATLNAWMGPLSLSWQSLSRVKGSTLNIPSAVIEPDASSLSEVSAGSASSQQLGGSGSGQNGESILVLETKEPPGIIRHYIIPPTVAKRVRLKKRGTKLRIANKHIFATQKIKSGLLCDVCSQKIGNRMAKKKAFVCRDCSLTTHKTCHTKIESDCSKSSLPEMEL
ncbi:uncharacterized protein LOC131883627 isoform X2 [Tigriopus californicus]|uniref:uncharacterized protein LOC131883627 isoform X2 n=1 Tax=Tigriopus californicus TaxID=6832 RepID=UPI0027DA8DC2|nr:uncharacterized protein LOC131883627 isoform X2 [Tigriopus californicus]